MDYRIRKGSFQNCISARVRMIQSLQSVKNIVRVTFGLLHEDDDEDEHVEVSEGVARLSDRGVVEAFPLLLPKLRIPALRLILSTLSGRKREANDLPWLLQKISQELKTITWQSKDDISRKVLEVFRDPSSFQKKVLPKKILLNESCPWTAAESALTQLDGLPLQCLHVMLEVLQNKPPEVIIGKLPVGGNKERLANALWTKGTILLSSHKAGDVLPEPLRRALVVMSLSARYAFGDDGNLVHFLGTSPSKTKYLQDCLLSAISDLKNLNSESVQLVFCKMVGTPKMQKKHRKCRQLIKNILLDCLLRSEIRDVPQEVKKVARTITRLARQQSGKEMETKLDTTAELALEDDAQIELEVEAVLRISSHLQQIMFNWNELPSGRSYKLKCDHEYLVEPGDIVDSIVGRNEISRGIFSDSGGGPAIENALQLTETVPQENSLLWGNVDLNQNTVRVDEILPGRLGDTGSGFIRMDALQVKEESLVIGLADEDGVGMNTRFQSDSLGKITQREDQCLVLTNKVTLETGKNKRKVHETDNAVPCPTETMKLQRITRIADEAAILGFSLIGCSMEKSSRLSGVSVKKRVRNYLCGDLKRKLTNGTGEDAIGDLDQVTMILSIAENMPIISHRVMDKVKRRLEMA